MKDENASKIQIWYLLLEEQKALKSSRPHLTARLQPLNFLAQCISNLKLKLGNNFFPFISDKSINEQPKY